ncbi:MAG TPA: GNAT family N-acetyltransferase [Tepidisphaeraceae bacterium]|nr:GNAT family N-acetyltransferase [Tepidisphaeraceae bacterium]
MSPATIRPARQDDLPAINDIYNHFVHICTCTYQEQSETMESRQNWFARHGERHPVIVAEQDGRVVGWGSLSPLHGRSAYRYTVEDSVYVHHGAQGRGIGSMLLQELIDRARTIGHHVMIASIDSAQRGSLALHARFGFQEVGHLHEVGFKFQKWLDVIYMELLLQPG